MRHSSVSNLNFDIFLCHVSSLISIFKWSVWRCDVT